MSDVRDAWWAMRHRVEREVASLSPDETTLVVSEVAPEPEPVKKGWFRRRPPPTPVRFIQFTTDGDTLWAEVVGPQECGGGWPVTPQQDRAIVDLGWVSPCSPDAQLHDVCYQVITTRGDAARVADLSIAALGVLDADPAAEWEWDRF